MWCPLLCFHSTLRSGLKYMTTTDLITAVLYSYLKNEIVHIWTSHFSRSGEKETWTFSWDNLLSTDLEFRQQRWLVHIQHLHFDRQDFLFLLHIKASKNTVMDCCVYLCWCLPIVLLLCPVEPACWLGGWLEAKLTWGMAGWLEATAWLPSLHFIQAHGFL